MDLPEISSNLTASKLANDSITVALDDLVTAAVAATGGGTPPAETEVVEDVDNAEDAGAAALEDVKGSAIDTGGGKITPDNPVLIFPLGLGIVTGLILKWGNIYMNFSNTGLSHKIIGLWIKDISRPYTNMHGSKLGSLIGISSISSI